MIEALRRADPAKLIVITGILLIIIAGTRAFPAFLTPKYLLQQAQIASFLGIVAVGAFCVILLGHIDLSVPWTMTASAIAATAFAGMEDRIPGATAAAIPVGLLVGAFLGAINGFGVAVLRVPSMIWTLGVNVVVLGCCVLVTGGFAPKGEATPLMRALAVGHTAGIPNATLIWFLLGAIAAALLGRFGVGRAIYAIGNGEKAAYLAGIRTGWVIFSTFVFAGLCSALGGLLLAGYANQAYQAMGDPFLLPAIATVVVGGASIQGGRGLTLNVMLAVVFVTLLTSLLSVLQMSEAQRQVVYGSVILVTLLIYGRVRRD